MVAAIANLKDRMYSLCSAAKAERSPDLGSRENGGVGDGKAGTPLFIPWLQPYSNQGQAWLEDFFMSCRWFGARKAS